MPVIAHAEHDRIEGAGYTREGLPGRHGAEIRGGRAIFEADEPRRRRRAFQQHVAHQLLIAGRIGRIDPALIGERDAHAAPIEAFGAQ